MESVHLSSYDFVVLGITLLLIARGIWLGMLKQIVPLLALYLGYFVASRYHEQLFPFLQDMSDSPRVVFLTAYLALFVITYLVAALLGVALSRVIQVTITSWFDRLLGGLLGFAKALILAVLVHILLGTIIAPENPMLRNCQTCGVLNEMAEFTRKIIKDENVREALRQQQPAITDAVRDFLEPAPADTQMAPQPYEPSNAPE